MITFSSFQAASKARKKYIGTHLCKKFQLRITHISPDSSTFSNTPIPVPIHSDEAALNVPATCSHEAVSADNVKTGNSVTFVELSSSMKSTSVLSSVHKEHLNHSEIASGDPTDLSNVKDSSTSTQVEVKQTSSPSSWDVPDKVDAAPLHVEKNVLSNATDIVIENLSRLVEEGELKALVHSCGAEVLSYNIQPDAIASETCVAKVSLADYSQAATAVNQLHERVLLKHKLRVFLADVAENKGMEPPIKTEQRKISSNLFQFITRHSHTQIEHFKQNGGVFNYQEGSAFLSCPLESVMTQFILKVFNSYTEKKMEFQPSIWCQLTAIKDEHTLSLLDKAKSSHGVENNVCIVPQKDEHAVLFTGTHEGVARAHSWLISQLNRELEVER